ncbi:C4-dicarboxylic acid, orotate and citrate transporter [Bradyrhizobium sp. ORS 285]|uniref:C4-dicarboxylate transporter DctA n=1 Tax=Bradyrhizobium sp. ORS 285 TaxID=115808 RepID=UPI00055408F7|nr:C4-dicarboxylate transporter DctA [Bradyrhizobium sp. ORS 285]SMX56543.1 C4-dicarboxylic acid, orotate and citrate transporter [Bradyrhizobium sp. ORS 285]
MNSTESREPASRAWYTILYVQVLIAIVLGAMVGCLWPSVAASDWVKALGDGFIKLIKMVIAPLVFCTVTSGIAKVHDAKKVGRIGVKALVYFEVVSSFALLLGLVMGNLVNVGHGLSVNLDTEAANHVLPQANASKAVDFFLNIIPDTIVGAFYRGDLLQVLLLAVLFGFSLLALGKRGELMRVIIDDTAHSLFGAINILMKAAPIGAFGAMSFTIGKFGPAVLGSLVGLIALFYVTAALFLIIVLGLIARLAGFSIVRFILYIKDELLLVLSTSSSESALPRLMDKLERLGCSRPVIGLVVPAGYSFNLDGTNIYTTLTTMFIAHSLRVDLTFDQQLTIVLAAMLTSKGASGVTGAGFITLTATLSAISPALVPGAAIVFSIDKFMSEARALTNIVGNGVAAVFVSWWEGELDQATLQAGLNRPMTDAGELPH